MWHVGKATSDVNAVSHCRRETNKQFTWGRIRWVTVILMANVRRLDQQMFDNEAKSTTSQHRLTRCGARAATKTRSVGKGARYVHRQYDGHIFPWFVSKKNKNPVEKRWRMDTTRVQTTRYRQEKQYKFQRNNNILMKIKRYLIVINFFSSLFLPVWFYVKM